jgi:hypothetical protein
MVTAVVNFILWRGKESICVCVFLTKGVKNQKSGPLAPFYTVIGLLHDHGHVLKLSISAMFASIESSPH